MFKIISKINFHNIFWCLNKNKQKYYFKKKKLLTHPVILLKINKSLNKICNYLKLNKIKIFHNNISSIKEEVYPKLQLCLQLSSLNVATAK